MKLHPGFEALGRVAEARVVEAIATLVSGGTPHELEHINILEFAADNDLSERAVIDAFVHASKLGIFDMHWNLLCPGCGGVLHEGTQLRHIHNSHHCALCADSFKPTLDEMVEVSFSLNSGLRGPVAPLEGEAFQMASYRAYFYPGLRFGSMASFEEFLRATTLEIVEIPPRGQLTLDLDLPSEFVIAFDPTTHSATFLDIQGEPSTELQKLTIIFSETGSTPDKTSPRPGPMRLVLQNNTGKKIVPGLFVANHRFESIFHERRPFFTATRLFTNQTFRDVYRTDALDIDQRLSIAALTILFTDLTGSTEFYGRVGDLEAYDYVREHFAVLADAVNAENGAVVKTIGDAVMATFTAPQAALAAAIAMRRAVEQLNEKRGHQDLLVKIGIHSGPCLAVMLNERLDYFGQAVNLAARVQGLANGGAMFVTESVFQAQGVAELAAANGLQGIRKQADLKGIAGKVAVYEIA